MRTSISATALALALGLTVVVAGPAAAAPVVSCGSEITADAVLTSDLTCAEGEGLTITAGATLDLGGHTLTGPGTAGTGVTIATRDATVVRNGTIRGWAHGVGVTDDIDLLPTRTTVDSTVFDRNAIGVYGRNSTYDITLSRFTRNGEGVSGGYTFASITASAFIGNTETGAYIYSGGLLDVDKSVFTDNPIALGCSETPFEVTSSVLTGNKEAVSVYFCGGAKVSGTTFVRNDRAYDSSFEFEFPGDELTGNRFIANRVAVTTAVDTTLTDNVFTRNQTALKTFTGFFGPTLALDGNSFTSNRDAVWITGPATLKDTVAVGNTRIGIHAPRATDLGGNIARGNGRQPQCTGVTCTAR